MTLTFSFRRKNKDVFDLRGGGGRGERGGGGQRCTFVELCTWHLLACQVRVTAGDSGLCCVHATSVERKLTPFSFFYFLISCL